MKNSKLKRNIRNSRLVMVPVTVEDTVVMVPVQKSAFLGILETFDKSHEFPATVKLANEDGDFHLHFGVE